MVSSRRRLKNSRLKKEQEVTKRKLFATRSTVKPLGNMATDDTRNSTAIARIPIGCKCKEPDFQPFIRGQKDLNVLIHGIPLALAIVQISSLYLIWYNGYTVNSR